MHGSQALSPSPNEIALSQAIKILRDEVMSVTDSV
jgi:hypothetical protein